MFFSKSSLSFPLISLIVALLNWVFWLIAARLIVAEEIGLASSILSIPILFSTIAMMGIEIPLMRSSSKNKEYFGTALFFELIIHLSLIPLVIISIINIVDDLQFSILAITLLIQGIVIIVSRFSLIGLFSIKSIIIIDFVGAISRILFLILFLEFGFDSLGILLASVFQGFVMLPILLFVCKKNFKIKIKLIALKALIIEGVSNFPATFAVTLRSYGIIPIMVLLGISQESIAGFTIAASIFMFTNLIPSMFATLALPSSTIEEKDLSSSSLKIGIVLSSPIITLIITSPALILGIYNEEYLRFSDMLLILGIGLIPHIVNTNVRTMLNNLVQLKKITILGVIESVIIISSVLVLTSTFGELGPAWAITIAAIVTAVFSLIWASNNIRKIFAKSVIAIISGIFFGLVIFQFLENEILVAGVSVLITIFVMFQLKLITFSEISFILSKFRKK